jgi:hypothetical protein
LVGKQGATTDDCCDPASVEKSDCC